MATGDKRVRAQGTNLNVSASSRVPLAAMVVPKATAGHPIVWLMLGAFFSALATALTVNFDTAISSSLRSWELPGDLEKAINLSEVFAHGFGVAAILGSLLWLVPNKRPELRLAILLTLVSGLIANGLKSGFVRVRPYAHTSIQVAKPRDKLSQVDHSQVNTSDGQAVPAEASFWDARQRSFPSGHSATAWGLAIGLTLAFPRGVALFASFALLASLQRLTSGAHYPTDVLAGATVAFFCCGCILSVRKRLGKT